MGRVIAPCKSCHPFLRMKVLRNILELGRVACMYWKPILAWHYLLVQQGDNDQTINEACGSPVVLPVHTKKFYQQFIMFANLLTPFQKIFLCVRYFLPSMVLNIIGHRNWFLDYVIPIRHEAIPLWKIALYNSFRVHISFSNKSRGLNTYTVL